MTGDSPVTACMPEARDCMAGRAGQARLDKVVYTKRQPITRQGRATGHARIVFSCPNRTQFKPTSAHSSDGVGARWTGARGVVLRIPSTSAARDTSSQSRVTPVFLARCGQTQHTARPSQAQLLRCVVSFSRGDRGRRRFVAFVALFPTPACMQIERASG